MAPLELQTGKAPPHQSTEGQTINWKEMQYERFSNSKYKLFYSKNLRMAG